ncbi:primosomal protein N' [bacterium]|nr:primosomal protein N' [bacterium]
MGKYARVIIDISTRALDHPFTYLIPKELAASVKLGSFVEVPFGFQVRAGFVVSIDTELTEDAQGFEIRPISAVLDDKAYWGQELLDLTRFMSRYYGCTWLEALQAAIPAPVLKNIMGRLHTKRAPRRRVAKDNQAPSVPVYPALRLTAQQEDALLAINESCQGGPPVLLYGVTGSGKTEVYLQAVSQCLQAGRQAMVLVPELSLTHQAIQRYQGRLGSAVGVLHSALPIAERRERWWAMQRGELQVALGTRSAVFAPLRNLGLIVIDEEHESSYKQENAPRYSTRQVAYKRARFHNAGLVLGSATPSIESYYAAKQGHYRLAVMSERASGQCLPTVHLLDMRRRSRGSKMIAPDLAEAIRQRIADRQQVVLYINRRGFSKYLQCNDCGMPIGCPDCSIPLTYHKAKGQMRCHYCGFTMPPPDICPNCQGTNFLHGKGGTERLLNEVAALVPEAKVLRMDRDTTEKVGERERILSEFASGEAQILLGTKMIAKGLDYPQVTLVGIINGDEELNVPDFRAAERCFQMLTQVSGRAGRGQIAGDVYLQVYAPEQLAVQAAINHDFAALYEAEIQQRRELLYPPFCRLVRVIASGADEAAVWEQITALAEYLRGQRTMTVLGPVACPLERLQNKYRYHVLCKCGAVQAAVDTISDYLTALAKRRKTEGISFAIDAEPQSLS